MLPNMQLWCLQLIWSLFSAPLFDQTCRPRIIDRPIWYMAIAASAAAITIQLAPRGSFRFDKRQLFFCFFFFFFTKYADFVTRNVNHDNNTNGSCTHRRYPNQRYAKFTIVVTFIWHHVHYVFCLHYHDELVARMSRGKRGTKEVWFHLSMSRWELSLFSDCYQPVGLSIYRRNGVIHSDSRRVSSAIGSTYCYLRVYTMHQSVS